MATLCVKTGKTPGYEIQFFDTKGRRITIYLGGRRYSDRTARELKDVVTTLVYNRDNSITTLDKRTLVWIESTSPEIREKLRKAELVEVPQKRTVKELWDAFLKQKDDVDDSTMAIYENSQKRFFAFFKGDELLTDLTQETMQRWKDYLLKEIPRKRPLSTGRGLAPATVAGTLTKTKAVFNWAVRSGWIETSPLSGVGRGEFVNEENEYIVTMDEYRQMLDACPCPDWRAIIALARIGGLRAPSEILRLRWSDVHWARSRFTATGKRIKGKKERKKRLVPLFPELRTELERLFESDSSNGQEFVINRYRCPDQNMRTTLEKILKGAGIEPFPRPFDNMRASRAIEIYAMYGEKAEVEWLGHSSKTAQKHYLRIHEGNYSRAVSSETGESILGNSADYGRCVELCREKNDFPAP